MTRHDPFITVRQMLDHVREVIDMAHGRRREHLDTDRMLNLSLVRLLNIVGEAATRVPEEFRTRYSAIPWRAMSNMRNRLVHGYDTINFDTVWSVIQDELPLLVEQLESIVADDV